MYLVFRYVNKFVGVIVLFIYMCELLFFGSEVKDINCEMLIMMVYGE